MPPSELDLLAFPLRNIAGILEGVLSSGGKACGLSGGTESIRPTLHVLLDLDWKRCVLPLLVTSPPLWVKPSLCAVQIVQDGGPEEDFSPSECCYIFLHERATPFISSSLQLVFPFKNFFQSHHGGEGCDWGQQAVRPCRRTCSCAALPMSGWPCALPCPASPVLPSAVCRAKQASSWRRECSAVHK